MFKKKISAVISVLLCVLLLGGCALDSLFEFDRADFTAKEICRFDDMEYVRPDVQAFGDKAQRSSRRDRRNEAQDRQGTAG